jgi:hypothetical protein
MQKIPRPIRASAERDRQRIVAKLGALGFVLPGSISARSSKCGNPGCVCHVDPTRLHGPYHSWTRTVRGTTVTRNLTDEQLERYQAWFDDARQLRTLLTDLKRVSLQAVHQAEGWDLWE